MSCTVTFHFVTATDQERHPAVMSMVVETVGITTQVVVSEVWSVIVWELKVKCRQNGCVVTTGNVEFRAKNNNCTQASYN